MKIIDINVTYRNVVAIYMIENIVNHKKYIGQTKDLHKRFQCYIKGVFNKHMSRAVDKYGIDNFEVHILERDFDISELFIKEKYWMEHYNTLDKRYGYNIQSVDDELQKYSVKDSTRKKISDFQKNPKTHTGMRKGSKHSEESKARMTKTRTGMPIIYTENRRRAFTKVQESNKKKVKQINKITGEVIKIWDSLTDICNEMNIHMTLLSYCLHGKRKTTGGFVWEFA